MIKSIALILALALPTTACLSSAQKTSIDQTAKTCAEQNLDQILSETGMSLLSTVMTYLAAGPSGWEAGLVALGSKYGSNAISCAVQIAEAFFAAEVSDLTGSASNAPATSQGIDYRAALANAQGFIARHPVK